MAETLDADLTTRVSKPVHTSAGWRQAARSWGDLLKGKPKDVALSVGCKGEGVWFTVIDLGDAPLPQLPDIRPRGGGGGGALLGSVPAFASDPGATKGGARPAFFGLIGEDLPLMSVTVAHFRGGSIVRVRVSHAVVDGTAFSAFVAHWAACFEAAPSLRITAAGDAPSGGDAAGCCPSPSPLPYKPPAPAINPPPIDDRSTLDAACARSGVPAAPVVHPAPPQATGAASPARAAKPPGPGASPGPLGPLSSPISPLGGISGLIPAGVMFKIGIRCAHVITPAAQSQPALPCGCPSALQPPNLRLNRPAAAASAATAALFDESMGFRGSGVGMFRVFFPRRGLAALKREAIATARSAAAQCGASTAPGLTPLEMSLCSALDALPAVAFTCGAARRTTLPPLVDERCRLCRRPDRPHQHQRRPFSSALAGCRGAAAENSSGHVAKARHRVPSTDRAPSPTPASSRRPSLLASHEERWTLQAKSGPSRSRPTSGKGA